MTSPAEHDAFARLTHHLRLASEALREVATLRPDQPWNQVLDLVSLMIDKIYRLAESGLRH